MTEGKTKFLLVDGHSIIHAWPDLRILHHRASKRYLAREELLKRMRLLQDVSGERIVVVFDGHGDSTSQQNEQQGIQIFYAGGNLSADGVIERLVARYASQFQVRVCTADGMIWQTVHSLNGGWLSPDDLAFELQRAEKELGRRLKG